MTNQFATQYPFNYPINGCFIVQNIITDSNKTIRIFDYPIPVGTSRDLLRIPGVSESSIRASLLKGTLRNKLIAKEIKVICSDIDLLQFNNTQKQFLLNGGIVNGLEVPGGITDINYVFKDEIPLIGVKDGINRVFTTPDKFLNGIYFGNNFHIHIKHNGRDIYEGIDYTISESGGVGTGFDTINIFSFTPKPRSLLFASYVIIN